MIGLSLRSTRTGGLLTGAEGSLRRKLIGGGAWHLGTNVYNSALLLAQTLLSTHFIKDPREFGLVNSVMWAYTLAEVFTTSGLTLALTQHRGDISRLVAPVWTVQLFRGLVLGLGVGLIGSLMSVHYQEPRIAALAWTAALSAPLNGLASLGPVVALRGLEFRKVALFGALETTLGAIAGCLLIVTFRSAWAVAVGLNAMAVARIVSSYCMAPCRPRFDLRWGLLRPFAGFAASTFLAAVLAFLNERGDDFMVGSLLGMEGLGLYHVAYLYANLPGLKIAQVLGNLLIPTFAVLCEEPARLRRAFLKFLGLVMGLAALLFVPLAALAPVLLRAIAGGRFLPAAPVFRVLCLFGALRFFQFTAEALFNARGQPRYATRAQLVQFTAMGLLIVPCIMKWGILGAGLAVTVGMVAATISSSLALRKLLALRPMERGEALEVDLVPAHHERAEAQLEDQPCAG
jgi:lipopolysaccharide exporter